MRAVEAAILRRPKKIYKEEAPGGDLFVFYVGHAYCIRLETSLKQICYRLSELTSIQKVWEVIFSFLVALRPDG